MQSSVAWYVYFDIWRTGTEQNAGLTKHFHLDYSDAVLVALRTNLSQTYDKTRWLLLQPGDCPSDSDSESNFDEPGDEHKQAGFSWMVEEIKMLHSLEIFCEHIRLDHCELASIIFSSIINYFPIVYLFKKYIKYLVVEHCINAGSKDLGVPSPVIH